MTTTADQRPPRPSQQVLDAACAALCEYMQRQRTDSKQPERRQARELVTEEVA